MSQEKTIRSNYHQERPPVRGEGGKGQSVRASCKWQTDFGEEIRERVGGRAEYVCCLSSPVKEQDPPPLSL